MFSNINFFLTCNFFVSIATIIFLISNSLVIHFTLVKFTEFKNEIFSQVLLILIFSFFLLLSVKLEGLTINSFFLVVSSNINLKVLRLVFCIVSFSLILRSFIIQKLNFFEFFVLYLSASLFSILLISLCAIPLLILNVGKLECWVFCGLISFLLFRGLGIPLGGILKNIFFMFQPAPNENGAAVSTLNDFVQNTGVHLMNATSFERITTFPGVEGLPDAKFNLYAAAYAPFLPAHPVGGRVWDLGPQPIMTVPANRENAILAILGNPNLIEMILLLNSHLLVALGPDEAVLSALLITIGLAGVTIPPTTFFQIIPALSNPTELRAFVRDIIQRHNNPPAPARWVVPAYVVPIVALGSALLYQNGYVPAAATISGLLTAGMQVVTFYNAWKGSFPVVGGATAPTQATVAAVAEGININER